MPNDPGSGDLPPVSAGPTDKDGKPKAPASAPAASPQTQLQSPLDRMLTLLHQFNGLPMPCLMEQPEESKTRTALRQTCAARPVSAEEARAWAEKKGQDWAKAQVYDQIETGKRLYCIDDDILTEDQLDEQYRSCAKCGALVLSEPLTWGVMQYQERDGDIVCNGCYADCLREALAANAGSFDGWPVSGSLTVEQIRHSLDERVVIDVLTASGWTKVAKGGGDRMDLSIHEYGGDSIEDTVQRFAAHVEANPQRQFVVTLIPWPLAAEATLWARDI